MEPETKKYIDSRINNIISFRFKKIGDTPIDALQLVNRKFVTMNGPTANRPKSSIMGQFYFDTSLSSNGKPIFWNGKGWVDATGTFV